MDPKKVLIKSSSGQERKERNMNARKITRTTSSAQTHEYVVSMVARGEPFEKYKPLWEDFIFDQADQNAGLDPNELVQIVLREAYLESNSDLRAYAEKVKYFNEVQKEMRDELKRLQSLKAGVEGQIKCLEDKLDIVGDDAQLANVDLQNVLQKQQQTLQMMSNISKLLNDTAMAVIRKIGS
jgi:hypothetical protein